MRIAVVGMGGTGSAAARFLAMAGNQVAGFERYRPGHDRGSSHGESRIIRYTYPDLLYTQMMGDAYPLWSALEEEAGEELFVRCGGLYFGSADNPHMREAETAMADVGLPYDRLTAGAAQDHFPAFRLRPDDIALFQRESGFLRATRCVLANTRLARTHGAEIHEETVVTAIEPRGDEVIVRTEAGLEQAFDRVIVTAGPWMGTLLAGLQMPLRVTRQQVVYLLPARNEALFAPDRFPVWIDADTNYYGFPDDGVVPGVKLACHHLGETFDPDRADRPVDTDEVQQSVAYATDRLPDLIAGVGRSLACLYTNTPDEDFIIDRAPDAPNVWLVSGCSGHGFKFTVLLGRIAASLALGEGWHHDLRRFALARFAGRHFDDDAFASGL